MYYVYIHKRKDNNEVFYVGQAKKTSEHSLRKLGNTRKAIYRRAFEKVKSRNEEWKRIVNECGGFKLKIVFETDNYIEAQEKEKELILLYKNTICNITPGGLGFNSNHTQETKDKISSKLKGRKLSQEHKDKVNKAKLKPISKYDLDNNFIKSFDSLNDAALDLGSLEYKKNISSCANGKRNNAYGFKWKYD